MYKYTASAFVVLLLGFMHLPAHAQQKMPDAAVLAPASAINDILGTHIVEGPSSVHGTYCHRTSADKSEEAIIQYVDFHDSKTAEQMLKLSYEGNQKDFEQNKTIIAVYETIKPMPEAGAGAHVMTGSGANSVWKNQVRFSFVLGNYLVTFDTRLIPISSVTEKLPAIYKMIKKNSGM